MLIATICLLSLSILFQLKYYMHMFQLNYYKTDMHFYWCKQNLLKLITRAVLSIIATSSVFIQNSFFSILSLISAATLLLLCIPKGKNKIKFVITARTIRLFAVEALIIFLIIACSFNLSNLTVKLATVSMLSFLLCIIANLFLSPIEIYGRNRYVKSAKKILAEHKNLIVIGITGSYGKTSMKNFLNEILSQKYNVLLTPKNYNTPLGISKTIKTMLKPTHDIFICEMGAMWRGDIEECCDIVNPTIGILTAIGPQHLQTFKSLEGIIDTKFELAEAIEKNNGVIFLDYDNKHISEHKTKANKITYGTSKKFDCYATESTSSSEGQKFTFVNKNSKFECQTKLLGLHNIENLTGAIAVAKYLGVEDRDIQFVIKKIKSVPHRLELINRGNLSIIDDSYNSNPISSKLAVDTLAQFEGKKIVVTPGLVELGNEEEKYNNELGEHIAKKADYVYLVGRDTQAQAVETGLLSKNYPAEKIQFVSSPQEAVNFASRRWPAEKTNILLLNDLPDNYN